MKLDHNFIKYNFTLFQFYIYIYFFLYIYKLFDNLFSVLYICMCIIICK